MTQDNHAESDTDVNDESQELASVSSGSRPEAADIPDGSSNDLPEEEQPHDDGSERFDAG